MANGSQAAPTGKLAQIRSIFPLRLRPVSDSRRQLENSGGELDRRQVARRAILVACGLALVLGGIVLWSWVLRDRFIPKRFGVVVPGKVYRSGQISRFLIANVIERNGIETLSI